MKSLDKKLASLKGEVKKLRKLEDELKSFSGFKHFGKSVVQNSSLIKSAIVSWQ